MGGLGGYGNYGYNQGYRQGYHNGLVTGHHGLYPHNPGHPQGHGGQGPGHWPNGNINRIASPAFVNHQGANHLNPAGNHLQGSGQRASFASNVSHHGVLAPASSHAYANPFRAAPGATPPNRGVGAGAGSGHWASNYNNGAHQGALAHSVARPTFTSNTNAVNTIRGANGINHLGANGINQAGIGANHLGANGGVGNPLHNGVQNYQGQHAAGMAGASAANALNRSGHLGAGGVGNQPLHGGGGPGNFAVNGLNGNQAVNRAGAGGGVNHLGNHAVAGNNFAGAPG